MILVSAFSLFLPLLMTPGNFAAGPQHVPGSIGVDISYPNCDVSLSKTDFGVVGVNGGRVRTLNPCFLTQAMAFGNAASLYVNTGWNSKMRIEGPKNCFEYDREYRNCLAYNYGYNAGVHAYYTANQQWIRSNTWWLDVETTNTWSDDVIQNQNSLQGEYDALKEQGVATIGVYSTSYQWKKITGGWKNGWPNWGATVVSTSAEAKSFCKGHEFNSGRTLLVQYKPENSPVSQDIAC